MGANKSRLLDTALDADASAPAPSVVTLYK